MTERANGGSPVEERAGARRQVTSTGSHRGGRSDVHAIGGRGSPSRIVGSHGVGRLIAILPALLLLTLFLLVPAGFGIRISLSSWPGFGDMNFIGWENYVRAFTDSPFVSSLGLTLIYAGLSAVGIIVVAVLLAAPVSAGRKGSAFYRAVWFLPGIAPIAASGVFWATAFQPGFGLVNVILGWFGLGSDHAPLADATTAIYPAIFVTIWTGVGFAFLLILGAMEQIDVAVYEAARIDGTGYWKSFLFVTLPLIRPVLAITFLLELIWNFNGFTVIWALTQGGPGYATSTLPVLVYRTAFQQIDFGLGSAMAVMGGILLTVVGLVVLRISRSRQS